MDCSPSGFSVHVILQARILKWVAISYSKESFWPRNQAHVFYVSCIGRWVLYHWHYLGSPTAFHGTLINIVNVKWPQAGWMRSDEAAGVLLAFPLNQQLYSCWCPRAFCNRINTTGLDHSKVLYSATFFNLILSDWKRKVVKLLSKLNHIKEEPEIKFANIFWVIEKAREFQKSIYFCFIDHAKAFDCVDHNKLWKILQEMGIPDHLTYLLRNLYAGQEATVRTGHRTTDWFQIGKGVSQGCKLSPC